MRKATTFLLLLTCILSLACAKTPAPIPTKTLEAYETDVVFDTISITEKTVITMPLASTGTESITITSFSIVGDNPDLQLQSPIAPIVLKPKQTTNIGLIFDPHGAGSVTAKVIIKTDSKTTPVITINLTANAFDPRMDLASLTPTITRLYKVLA